MISSIFGILALAFFFIFVTGIVLNLCEIEIIKFRNLDTAGLLIIGCLLLSSMFGILSWIFR